MLKKTAFASVALLLAASSVVASPQSTDQFLSSRGLFVNGMTPVKITLNNGDIKTVRLINLSLSSNVQNALANKAAYLLAHPMQKNMSAVRDLPPAKNDGMNGEPVLDQGEWGTCATFSTTAAINALYSLSGDAMVSQLCNLELGRTLNNPQSGDGGWQGTFGFVVFGQIAANGYVNKQYQHDTGCGGLKNYPAYSFDSGAAMSQADFTANSIKTFTDKDWTPILAYNGNFSPIDPAAADIALNNVKNAVNQGDRVVFGTLIDGNVGQVGAAGSYNNVANDVWVMTTQMQQDLKNGAVGEGHEIVIEGYDDNACATYTDGNADTKQQCGLLRIRNSWGASAGDQGDYYMSYDHFKGMVIEAYAIGADAKDRLKIAK